MPFYKRDGETLITAQTAVISPEYELRAETNDQYTYPVDGWVWADSLDAAMSDPRLKLKVAEVTMRQARRALFQTGKLAAIEAAIDALPEPQKTVARIEWEYSAKVQRHNGFVSQIAPLLSLSDADVDALFALAETL